MSLKALPLVFINLSGEMMYIIDQRLKAQKIAPDKASKVVSDLINTMMNQPFLDELFKPQELYSRKAMKTVFEKLAHSSIMKLNATSMEKLYDLMTMVLKYQVCACPLPGELLFITLNHLDGIRGLVEKHPAIIRLVDMCYSMVLKHYFRMGDGELQIVRCAILNFFQDLTVKVSVFLRDGIQSSNGAFKYNCSGHVPRGTGIPGTIIEYSSEGDLLETSSFDPMETYADPLQQGCTDLYGYRGTRLGCNIYENYPTEQGAVDGLSIPSAVKEDDVKDPQSLNEESQRQDKNAQEELALLAHLLGSSSVPQFTLNLFASQDEETSKIHAVKDLEIDVVEIDVSKEPKQNELSKIMSDFTFDEPAVQSQSGNDIGDLFDLLDSEN